MIQSPNDEKEYKAITLDNGLRVLLVHNEETHKSAAALAVNAGHFNDPENRQGLAHFLEHMLFLGTKKFPDGSEYQKFISQHGGSNNAWTGTEHTCYFFDIGHAKFAEALDRFSDFFTSPLLAESFVASERENIDAEFKLKLKDDIRRIYDVHKATINPKHPFAKFSVGNRETLADHNDNSIRDELLVFYQQYYRAQYMTLVLEGPQSLETLERQAGKYFSSIPTIDHALPDITEPLYLPENKQVLITVSPVKDDKQLIISFALPAIDHHYRNKPESVLAYLLGHEGVGSLLSLLKEKQWALGLTAGSGINGSNFKDFNISISLTDSGEQHINEIVSVVFGYIHLIGQQPIADFYYQEKKAIAALAFNYHEKQKPIDSASQLVINMQHYPVEDYIYGDYAMDNLDQNAVSELLSLLAPNNMRLIHVGQNNTFDKVTTWYQVPYSVENIASSQLDEWLNTKPVSELHLPRRNKYIVAEPKIITNEPSSKNDNDEPIPAILIDQPGTKIWFKPDTTFNVPKGYIYIGIDSHTTLANDSHIAMTRLYVDMISNALVEQYYDAELAGIHYNLFSHQGGITLQLSGISEKQGDLLQSLLTDLKSPKFNEKHFSLFKQQLLLHWQNAENNKSISQLFSVLSSTMQPQNPNRQRLAKALEEVDYQTFLSFAESIFDQISIEALIHGNWNKQQANDISANIISALSQQANDNYKVNIPIADLENQQEIIVPLLLKEHDHACVIYYPFPNKELNLIACSMITSQLLSPLFFQEMRTEKQYGYLVGVGFIPINRFPGIGFYIQSPHTESPELANAISEFINNIPKELANISAEDWHQIQYGLAAQLQENDTSLRIKSQRFWASICNDDKAFNKKQALINAILNLTLEEITQFVKTYLLADSNPARLTLASFENQSKKDNSPLPLSKMKTSEEILTMCARKY